MVVSYLMGFGAVLFFMRSTILLLFYNPPQDFQRLRRVAVSPKESKGIIRHEWEPFPEEVGLRRMFWVSDLLINLRGIGWSFRKPCFFVPKDIQKLYLDHGIDVSTGNPSFKPIRSNHFDRSMFFSSQCILFATRYLLVDICINLMDSNPLFQGSGHPLHWIYPVSIRRFLLFLYNSVLGTVGVYAVMDLYATCLALTTVGLLGPNNLGTWGEPFMYPRLWGSVSEIWNGGLIGLWSTMWHDAFKHTFTAFSNNLLPKLPDSAKSSLSSSTRNFLRLQIIFFLSGLCHAAGSQAQLTQTYPVLTLVAFASQAIGIWIQLLVTSLLEKRGIREVTRKVVVLCFAVVWSYFTMHMFLVDLAATKAFQLRLIPFSVLGLAMGRRWPGWLGS
ncbi:hypothetical protein EG329_013037 [Mollisiaceae sp. DMI_Dod_QoI]|nr:hypothetical protein EG329_013037 [Helotiales sp. DMI_Dod_QoI]